MCGAIQLLVEITEMECLSLMPHFRRMIRRAAGRADTDHSIASLGGLTAFLGGHASSWVGRGGGGRQFWAGDRPPQTFDPCRLVRQVKEIEWLKRRLTFFRPRSVQPTGE
jgi:hypothetical protein